MKEFGLEPFRGKFSCEHMGCSRRAKKSGDGSTKYCAAHMKEYGLEPHVGTNR